MIKGFLFDLDGVIVDTAKYHFLAWKQLADELSIPFTEEDNELLKGVSRTRSLDIVLGLGNKSLSHEEKETLASTKNKEYVAYVDKMTPDEILPGVLKFIRDARAKNIKIALGSASKNAVPILENLGIFHLFDALITGNDVVNAKPDPEVFLKGAEALGLQPEECVVFEDAIAGVQAAKNGKMKCIGIGSKDVLGDADLVVDGFNSLCISDAINI